MELQNQKWIFLTILTYIMNRSNFFGISDELYFLHKKTQNKKLVKYGLIINCLVNLDWWVVLKEWSLFILNKWLNLKFNMIWHFWMKIIIPLLLVNGLKGERFKTGCIHMGVQPGSWYVVLGFSTLCPIFSN